MERADLVKSQTICFVLCLTGSSSCLKRPLHVLLCVIIIIFSFQSIVNSSRLIFFSACLLLVNVVAKVMDGKLAGPGKLSKWKLTGARGPALFHLSFPVQHDSYGM